MPVASHLDLDYIHDLIHRLAQIPERRRPRWGALRKPDLIEHLIWHVRYCMNRIPLQPVLVVPARPLLRVYFLHSGLPWPRNLRYPAGVTSMRSLGDLEDLHALLEDYAAWVQAGELAPPPHPVFGEIGVDGWERFHVRHFEHHLAQFGV
ncbi:MAG: DUF1569 domain-containing protein [Candidatus Hydrogenedentes bacterium]|nr:DUF1569 domain-containing protein [Candidatus Hydrogenedentota bacterium]